VQHKKSPPARARVFNPLKMQSKLASSLLTNHNPVLKHSSFVKSSSSSVHNNRAKTTTFCSSTSSQTSKSVSDIFLPSGCSFPGAYISSAEFGRGLFSKGESPEIAMTSTPMKICAVVPEDTKEKLTKQGRERLGELYGETMDVGLPRALSEFLSECEQPKDVRMAVLVLWLCENSEEWRRYRSETLPKEYESLYLASEDELEELQDVQVKNMAIGSRKMYERQMEQLLLDPLFLKKGVSDMIRVEDLGWARSVAHTRAMSGKLEGSDGVQFSCAIVVPGADLTNHRTISNANYGVSEDGKRYELKWKTKKSIEDDAREGLPPPPENEREPREGLEMFICYGARHPNALLALHYGFVDDTNPNDRIPMECVMPGMRKVSFKIVNKAIMELKAKNDDRAAWAGSQLLAVSKRSPENVPDEIADQKRVDAEIVNQMKAATVAALSLFPTTLEEDEQIDFGKIKSSRRRVAISYRITQKRHLHAYQRFLDKLISM
jgi:hypothetical protein